MKRFTALLVSSALALGVSYLLSCSDPLDVNSSNNPTPGGNRVDTVFIFDTSNTVDTLIIFDTVIIIDSNNTVDTVIIIDTVTFEDDDDDSDDMCGRISCNKKEIVWMFRNPEGIYNLEFSASTERDQPAQTMVVTIDGQPFTWNVADNSELIKNMNLSENAKITISLENPGAYGHAIDVCLEMTGQ